MSVDVGKESEGQPHGSGEVSSHQAEHLGYAAANTISAVMERDVTEAITEKDPQEAVDIINQYMGFLGEFDLQITQPAYADIDQHQSREDFAGDVNVDNVLLFLLGGSDPDGICQQRRQRPCYQRFAFLLPDAAASLRDKLHDHSGGFHALSPEDQEQVAAVYRTLRLLVDKNDPYVADENGNIDSYYLKR
jgi:hypothetical protein